MSGFVYFIGPEALVYRPFLEEGACVKIGYTRQRPLQRLAALQTGSPLHLVLWAYIKGSSEVERALHKAFAPLRSHGEWFYVTQRLWGLLSHLGEEPNIGNFVNSADFTDALHANLCNGSPHPKFTEQEWASSADIEPLLGFFPSLSLEEYQ